MDGPSSSKRTKTTPTASATSDSVPEVQAPALDIQNVNFKYGSVEVLKNVTMAIPQGARCLLVGDNGAGKSTLLKLLGGRHSKLNLAPALPSPELTSLSPQWSLTAS